MKILIEVYKIDSIKKEIRIFPNQKVFLKHIKHFKKRTEPWHLLPNGKKLKSLCQKFNDNNVIAIEQIYKVIVPILIKGMKSSVSFPLYVTFSEKKPGKPRTKKTILLTHFGFYIVLNKKSIVSAYFISNNKYSSLIKCCHNAYEKIKRRMKNEEQVKFFSEEHWESFCNITSFFYKGKDKKNKKRGWTIPTNELDKLNELL